MESTIYFKLFLNGTQTRVSAGVVIPTQHIGKNKTIKNARTHAEIEREKTKLHDFHALVRLKNPNISASKLWQEFTKPIDQTQLEGLIHQFMTSQKVSAGTQKTYRTYRKNFLSFLKINKLENITVHDLDAKLAYQYIDWLQVQDYGSTHVVKCFHFVTQVIRYAQRQEVLGHSSFLTVKRPKRGDSLPKYLDLKTFEKLEVARFANEKLERVQDLFLFQTYLGIDYGDLESFNLENSLKIDDDGMEWIEQTRRKTGVMTIVPFFPKARQIWDKYEGKLPIISNQKYNTYLKEIAFIVGISDHLTTHVARHTAGTYWLNEGVSLEVVSRMLGHKNSKITEQVYTRILKKCIKSEVKQFLHKKTA